jgi:NAD+ synthase (glutamine-hydrolysing)
MALRLADFGIVRVATIAPELKVADIDYNIDKIMEAASDAANNGANIVLFPELAVTGYTCGDLFFQHDFVKAAEQSLLDLAEFTSGSGVTLIVGVPVEDSGKLFNCAAVISQGSILGLIPKSFLCNTSQYYEERWFSAARDSVSTEIIIGDFDVPFGTDMLFENELVSGLRFGVEICEDLWAVTPPSNSMAAAGATVIFNLSASDEYIGKYNNRLDIVAHQSMRCMGAYVYSSCGANESTSELLYSGATLVAENGVITAEGDRFSFSTEICYADIDIERIINRRMKNNTYGSSHPDIDYRIIDVEFSYREVSKLLSEVTPDPFLPKEEDKSLFFEEILNIQSTALARRIRHIGIKSVVVGVSGGLDSTMALLAICAAFDKLGLDRKGIYAVSMPGFGTSNRTKSNAEILCECLEVNYELIDITDSTSVHFKDIKHDESNINVVFENAQARRRTHILMDKSNQVGGIVIGTGDLSEIAQGWSTYNGDQMSMYGINAGLPKTLIQALIAWIADSKFKGTTAKVLKDIVDTPVSPELLPLDKEGDIEQKTEEKIGPYRLHDFFLYYMIMYSFAPDKIFLYANEAFEGIYSRAEIKKWLSSFYKRFFTQQFKRSSMPDGIKISEVSLSPKADWRMPSDASLNWWMKIIEQL